jgi:hypothetical protein
MTVTRRSVIGSVAITALSGSSGRSNAEHVPTIRIGVLTDRDPIAIWAGRSQ